MRGPESGVLPIITFSLQIQFQGLALQIIIKQIRKGEFEYIWQNFACKRPCTETTYEVQAKQLIKSSLLEISLEFESSVDVTWNRFSSSVMDVFTGFGGSVRRMFVIGPYFKSDFINTSESKKYMW